MRLGSLAYASIVYTAIILPWMVSSQSEVDILDMESVFAMFQNPDVFFVGWMHYLAFDLLAARGLAMDALQVCSVSYFTYYLAVVPCLLMTLYVGPVGFLLYSFLLSRRADSKPSAKMD